MWILSDTFDIITPGYIVWSRFRPHRYDYIFAVSAHFTSKQILPFAFAEQIFQYIIMMISLQVQAK